MKNTLTDLNNHLFAQIERLGNEDMTAEALVIEIDRSKALTDVSKSIVSNASLQLEALKLKVEHQGMKKDDIPVNLIGGGNG